MGKVMFWLVVIFAVLFVVRLVNASKAKRRAADARARSSPASHPMVRCARCGVFLPKSDATAVSAGNYVCADPACAKRG